MRELHTRQTIGRIKVQKRVLRWISKLELVQTVIGEVSSFVPAAITDIASGSSEFQGVIVRERRADNVADSSRNVQHIPQRDRRVASAPIRARRQLRLQNDSPDADGCGPALTAEIRDKGRPYPGWARQRLRRACRLSSRCHCEPRSRLLAIASVSERLGCQMSRDANLSQSARGC